jgi:PGF-CTERM protein
MCFNTSIIFYSQGGNMKKKQMLLTVVMVLAVFAALTTAAAADTIAGDRTISPTSLPAGNTFTVTVDVTVTGTVYGPVLNEDIPAGWTVTSAGASYSAAETTWIWLDEVTAGTKTVIYEVTVPTGTAAGNYPVTGTVLATVGGETIGPDGVTGNNLVTVIDGGTGETDTIAGDRTISPPSLPAGNTFTVTVDVIVTGTVYGPVLNEDIPAGWTVTEVANAGASYSAAETTWMTVVYDVTVPTGTANGDYPVTGTVLATVGGSGIGPYSVTGDDGVTVADNTQDTSHDDATGSAPSGSGSDETPKPGPLPDVTMPESEEDASPTPSLTPATTQTTAPPATTIKKPDAEPKEGFIPGFEAAFVIAGLLVVAYLVRRRR